ncbi:MAG TPA: nodulation protein NfeD [Candidatus Krumholzibacteria bacterium]|nr:nodulation protein NfeD [Candidatus Krumholzibacteria bacterium]HPD72491.1 nodulation protein NfeD [Candidatus Krumholzibacteria bacterium]HRY40577.1 nodulation protein NfeD [Candidatus Krumholzibacteria bacterium]
MRMCHARLRALPWLSCGLGLVLVATASAQETPPDSRRPLVHLVPFDGPITPVASEYVTARLEQAADAGADAVVIELDTPGGLDVAMRTIVKAILAAPLPVVVFVAPPGARAASAGAFITIAAHVAAMAPGTNIGSASPVQIGGAIQDSTMSHKVTNDAAAYIAALAHQRGRDEALARRFVTEAINLTATEARAAGLIDVIAETVPALLDSLHGRLVTVGDAERVLDLAGASIEALPMGPRQRFLKWLADPNVAYILMLLGIYGLFFELSNPGALVPGILGGISLLLALFAFQALPVNYAGIGLILLGMVMLILEVKVHSYGGLTIGGLASLVLGSLLLFDSPEPWARLSLSVMVPGIAVFAGFFVLCVWLVVRAQRRPALGGKSALAGDRGRVVEAIGGGDRPGKVVFHGEMWDAVADAALAAGTRIEVIGVSGRLARVRPLPPERED